MVSQPSPRCTQVEKSSSYQNRCTQINTNSKVVTAPHEEKGCTAWPTRSFGAEWKLVHSSRIQTRPTAISADRFTSFMGCFCAWFQPHDFFHILATKPQHEDMRYVLTFSSTLFFAFTSGKYSTAKLQLPTEVWLLHVQTAVTAASVNSKGLCWHYFLISWSVPRINILHKEHLSWPDWIQSEVLINALSGYGTYRTFTASLEILGQPRFFINEIHLYATQILTTEKVVTISNGPKFCKICIYKALLKIPPSIWGPQVRYIPFVLSLNSDCSKVTALLVAEFPTGWRLLLLTKHFS